MHSQTTKNPRHGRPGFFAKDKLASFISESASYALSLEVYATPKPGLVDMNNNGAHQDMNIATFEASIEAIAPYLGEMASCGFDHSDDIEKGLFPKLRMTGLDAERAMLEATDGVNTHKGIIFSMGVLCGAYGWHIRQGDAFDAEELLKLCGTMTTGELEQDFAKMLRSPVTNGEKLYAEYGLKGARGEVQGGFPSVRLISLPCLRRLRALGTDENRAHVQTLLELIAGTDDTCIASRGGIEALDYAKSEAQILLQTGGVLSQDGLERAEALDRDFIAHNLSPGGSADLLAITIFTQILEKHESSSNSPSNHNPNNSS